MQASRSLAIKYVGSTALDNLPSGFQTTVKAASQAIEEKYARVEEAKIQGSQPHKSSKDSSDDKDVITVSYHTATGTRVVSVHVHDDGTYNEFPSRAGR